jgi:hypothetical protein
VDCRKVKQMCAASEVEKWRSVLFFKFFIGQPNEVSRKFFKCLKKNLIMKKTETKSKWYSKTWITVNYLKIRSYGELPDPKKLCCQRVVQRQLLSFKVGAIKSEKIIKIISSLKNFSWDFVKKNFQIEVYLKRAKNILNYIYWNAVFIKRKGKKVLL